MNGTKTNTSFENRTQKTATGQEVDITRRNAIRLAGGVIAAAGVMTVAYNLAPNAPTQTNSEEVAFAEKALSSEPILVNDAALLIGPNVNIRTTPSLKANIDNEGEGVSSANLAEGDGDYMVAQEVFELKNEDGTWYGFQTGTADKAKGSIAPEQVAAEMVWVNAEAVGFDNGEAEFIYRDPANPLATVEANINADSGQLEANGKVVPIVQSFEDRASAVKFAERSGFPS